MYDCIIVGCGFFGAVAARMLADHDFRVHVIEKENEEGGLTVDYRADNGVMVHKFGPHVLNLDTDEVYEFLSQYTEWIPVAIERKVFIEGRKIPLPINLNSIEQMYKDSDAAVKILINEYGCEKNIPLFELMNSREAIIRQIAVDIYNKVYLGYNQKMWGLRPEDLAPAVVARMPIRTTYNSKSNHCKHQIIPDNGYVNLFNKILDKSNISVMKGCRADQLISIRENRIYFKGEEFLGKLIYTAPLDELFGYRYGILPYRAIRFEIEEKTQALDESAAVITYPNDFEKTRTTDMALLYGNMNASSTVWVSEYPREYQPKQGLTPSYPVLNSASSIIFEKYKNCAAAVKNLYIGGRLASFQYYDMEDTICAAMECSRRIIHSVHGIHKDKR